VIAPSNEPRVEGTLLQSYQILAAALLRTLHILGINARADNLHDINPSGESDPVCFQVPSNYEITIDGKKIIGSAQVRRTSGMLQHGSLPLRGDLTRINHAFNWNSESELQEANRKLLSHATTLEKIIAHPFQEKEN